MSSEQRLSLCHGRRRRDGWKTLDANPRSGCDIVAEIPPLPIEVTSNAWDCVELIHGIEHFYRWDAVTLLKELRHVMKPGGVIVLEQPNIEYAASVLLGQTKPPRGNHGQFDMWPLYGDPTHRDPLYVHRWGYSPSSLVRMLSKECGYEHDVIAVRPARSHFPVRDFRVEITIRA